MIKFINKPSIQLTQLEFAPVSNSQAEYFQKTIGLKPYVSYYGYQIQDDHIISMSIDNNKFIPTLSMQFYDKMSIMKDVGFPVDDSVITVFIRGRVEKSHPIYCDFKITKFININKDSNNRDTYYIEGVLNVKDLFLSKQEAFRTKSSYDTFKELAELTKLGFASNVNNSNDVMTRVNYGVPRYKFIQNETETAYLDEKSFLWTYIDLYYNLNYIDIETQIEEDVTSVKGIVNNAGYSKDIITDSENDKESLTELFLTNDKSQKSTDLYFNEYEIINMSTDISLKNGYSRNIMSYDRKGNFNEHSGAFLDFTADSITTPNAEGSVIIMKGAPQDVEFFKEHKSLNWVGKFDSDNVFIDYRYAQMNNQLNLMDIQKVAISITLPNLNMNLYRFQKIRVIFSHQTEGFDRTLVNSRLTGYWVITGISYEFSRGLIKQKVKLIKRELNDGDYNF